MAKLTAEQYIAIGWLCKPRKGGKTYAQVAEMCGVTDRTLENWRKDPVFDRELKRAIVRENSDKLPEVVESMASFAIREGNAAAAKLLFQINDMLTDRVEVETKNGDNTDVEALKQRIAALKNGGKSEGSE